MFLKDQTHTNQHETKMRVEVGTTKSPVALQLHAIPIPIKQQSLPSRIISLKTVPCNVAIKQAPRCTGSSHHLLWDLSHLAKTNITHVVQHYQLLQLWP